VFGEQTETDRQTATHNCEISTVWEMKPMATPQNTSQLLVGPEQVTRPTKTQQAIRWCGGGDDDDDDDKLQPFAVPLYRLFTARHSYT